MSAVGGNEDERVQAVMERATPAERQRIRRAAYKTLAQADDVQEARIAALYRAAGVERPLVIEAPAVPWIVEWSSESRFEVRPCKWAGGRMAMWQPFSPGVGRPNFANKHVVRQRRAVAENLCNVCGKAIDVHGTVGLDIEGVGGGDDWFTLLQPLFHLGCIEASIRHCPHLRAGFKAFAPYRGPLRRVMLETIGAQAKARGEFSGMAVRDDMRFVTFQSIQIPVPQLEQLRSIAV